MSDSPERNRVDPADFPHPIFNWLSITGMILLACCTAAGIFFLLIGFMDSGESGYAVLLVLPPLLLAGLALALIVVGLVRERWRHRQERHSSFLERIVVDPLELVRRTGPLVIGFGLTAGTFGLLGAGAGSLAVVEYSESNEFCGEFCHSVMNPEASAYEHSSHARIDCVECHVGEGGDSYIRAKLGGLRQLWAFTTGDISRPIHTPIPNRRLSREMCESCHTAEREIGYKAISRTYFPSGRETEPVALRMIVKVGGGGNDGLMPGAGIHYHMLAERKVEFIARDAQRQEIAWIRVTSADGQIKEYSNSDEPLTDEERTQLEVHRMECVDCHSRPAHRFPAPMNSVNEAIGAGRIARTLPRIKEASVRALDGGYASTDEAMEQIAQRLREFYEEEAPGLLDGRSAEFAAVAPVLQQIYRRTIFPEMKADWRAHPDNIGHRDSAGCFRCHNDVMLDEDGEAVFNKCTVCHAILAQNERVIETSADFEIGRSFIHPEDSESFDDEFTLCTDCHDGGADLYD
jgi:nitrate/TMAO reductase-like tetraheme cytochrome c subunit